MDDKEFDSTAKWGAFGWTDKLADPTMKERYDWASQKQIAQLKQDASLTKEQIAQFMNTVAIQQRQQAAQNLGRAPSQLQNAIFAKPVRAGTRTDSRTYYSVSEAIGCALKIDDPHDAACRVVFVERFKRLQDRMIDTPKNFSK